MQRVAEVTERRRRTGTVEIYAEAPLPTHRGLFRTVVFRERAGGAEHVAMVGALDLCRGGLSRAGQAGVDPSSSRAITSRWISLVPS